MCILAHFDAGIGGRPPHQVRQLVLLLNSSAPFENRLPGAAEGIHRFLMVI